MCRLVLDDGGELPCAFLARGVHAQYELAGAAFRVLPTREQRSNVVRRMQIRLTFAANGQKVALRSASAACHA